MQHIILKNDIDPSKMEALIKFLKSWNVDAELKRTPLEEKKKVAFSLSAGIWKNYNIDSDLLRKQAWNRSK
jgi:hypothetical protein